MLVAYSGGPDSTALLAGLAAVAGELGLSLTAAHLDHAADPDSGRRADAAAALAAEIGVPIVRERRPLPRLRRPGESFEAAARRERYAFLDQLRRAQGARWIATAHHRDDQAETVLLRLLYGSGIEGLAAIRPRSGHLLRPLLTLPRLVLANAVAKAGLVPVVDPTNASPAAHRNRLRHELLPELERRAPGLSRRLASLADSARGAGRRLTEQLLAALEPRSGDAGIEIEIDRAAFQRLPAPLHRHALALLHRLAGAPYPGTAGARRELARQLAAGGGVGCDCGGGWRWRCRGGRLALVRTPRTGASPVRARAARAAAGTEIRQRDTDEEQGERAIRYTPEAAFSYTFPPGARTGAAPPAAPEAASTIDTPVDAPKTE